MDIHASEWLELEALGNPTGLSPTVAQGSSRAPQRTILTHIGVPIDGAPDVRGHAPVEAAPPRAEVRGLPVRAADGHQSGIAHDFLPARPRLSARDRPKFRLSSLAT
ncbi:hypothetical protein GCM10007881_11960 [Mesorhizobium huakuii]|nr:hypothetical protein GCM10007881_11960 [Mesorhizobium huakuii]